MQNTRNESQRLNVATTRARDQLWLFSSLRPAELNPRDLRRSLLAYMTRPPAPLSTDPRLDRLTPDERHDPFEALFEQQIFLELRRRGYLTVPHFAFGEHQVDLLVVGDSAQLAVQCQTPDLPATPEIFAEQFRQERTLQRAGWNLCRIRHSSYQADPAATLRTLWQHLDRLDIAPHDGQPTQRTFSDWKPLHLTDEEMGED